MTDFENNEEARSPREEADGEMGYDVHGPDGGTSSDPEEKLTETPEEALPGEGTPSEGSGDPGLGPGEHRGYAIEEEERISLGYWAIVTGQFKKNRLARASLWVLLAMYLIAVYAPLLSFRIPFIYSDSLRQSLREGDRVEIGSIVLEVSGEPVHASTGSEDDGWFTRGRAAVGRFIGIVGEPKHFFLTRQKSGEEVQIRTGIRAGASKGCAFREHDGDLKEVHAVFGLFGGHPFVREVSGDRTVKVNGALLGETSFPFFRSLFDRNEFEMNVDRFFNLMMFAVPLLLVLYALWRAAARPLALRTATVRMIGALGAALVLVIGYLAIAFFPLSEPYRDFRVELIEGGADMTTLSPILKTDHRWGFFPPIRRSYRDQNAEIRTKAPWKEIEEDLFLAPLRSPGGSKGDVKPRKRTLFKLLYLFGTDNEGRDVFTRLLYGTRISLTIGIFAVAIYVAIGVFFGGLAGFFGGWADIIVMRFIEIMMCFPTFFLILTLISILESRSIFWIMLIIGVTGWTGVARLVRGEFLKQKSIDYVTAAKALGVGRMKIMFKHILPNAMAPVLVAATFGIAAAILTETSLSFLGLGDMRAPSWGQLLVAGRKSQEYYLILISGFSIFFTVTILNLVGEGVRDALDPKLRK